MRYYKIVISTPATPGSSSVSNTDAGGDVVVVAGTKAVVYQTFASVLTNGANDPGALNIELDLAVAGFAQPLGPTQAFLRIQGPSVKQIGSQANLNGKTIQIYGGMGRGLPLATQQSAYQGLLASGVIFQAFANWVGTDMSLEMVIEGDTSSKLTPRNLSGTWPANMPLAQAITNTLQNAYPEYTVNVAISSLLTTSSDQSFVYSSLAQLAQWIEARSKSIIGDPNYQGVQIVARDKVLYVFDGTTKTQPKQLLFSDLIGQPTWQGPGVIQITSVMRSDIFVNSYIQLPQGIPTTASAQQFGTTGYVTFQGSYMVTAVRHVGNFRSPDALSWVTVINATPNNYVSPT